MPHLSDEVQEGVVVTWFVAVGDPVREDDLLAQVQVQKVSTEVRSPFSGRITALLVEPGGVVAQGAPIALLEAAGSVAGGRNVEAEVAAAAPRRAEPRTAPAAPGGPRIEPLSPMRRAIADRLQSWQAATAQLTLTAEADVTDLAQRLEALRPGQRVSYVAAAVLAAALALRDHPRVGARWSEAGLVYPTSIDIGVAVALPEGLITPVVRDADGKDLETIDREIEDLAGRARSARLMPAETEGGIFSVTNLGAERIDAFTPLLTPSQTAILGLGRARRRPAVVGDAILPRLLQVLSLTFDHRVLDGAPAAAFLTAVVESLEDPARLKSPPEPAGRSHQV